MQKLDFASQINDLEKPSFMAESTSKSSSDDANSTDSTQKVQDVDEIWTMVFESIKMIASKRVIQLWYKDVYLSKVENGIAEISCDNPMKREWIESNHTAIIKNKLSEVLGYKPEVKVSIRSSVRKEASNSDDSGYEYYDPNDGKESEQSSMFTTASPNSTPQKASNQSINPNLNPKYTLEQFVVGSNNQLGVAVAEGVIDDPGTTYNPLFFYGPSGVGKTHLMQSIGNAILTREPSTKVVYAPIETFMNDLVESIRTRKTEEFRAKYRPIDVLILDDIQFISNFKKTQEELFNTFNALYQTNKQIVIASDRPPKEIDSLPDRLRTRFEGGMVVDIQLPDYETRMAILNQKVIERGADIPEEILNFIANNLEASVRELEGAVTKVITHMKFAAKDTELDDIAKLLKVDLETKRRRIKPNSIIKAVAEIYGISISELKSRKRTAYIAMARQVAMYLMREELELPLDTVASHVNRKDHTTVMHACNKVEELLETDNKLADRIKQCKEVYTS